MEYRVPCEQTVIHMDTYEASHLVLVIEQNEATRVEW